MMNTMAKALVLAHTALSIAAMTWAIMAVLLAKDFGWKEPAREVIERTKEGAEKTAVRFASEYDKSVAALREAEKTRDSTYVYVKPALDAIRDAEPYLPNNHLFYVAELKRLQEAPDNIEVKRLKDDGNTLETPASNLGKPVFGDKVDAVTKSRKTYQADLNKLFTEIDEVEKEIRTLVVTTKKITTELTGTDEKNQYVQPGLYQLIDLEFKAQSEIKTETENIKPNWSQAQEQARNFMLRRRDLEATLEKLQGPAPKNQKQ